MNSLRLLTATVTLALCPALGTAAGVEDPVCQTTVQEFLETDLIPTCQCGEGLAVSQYSVVDLNGSRQLSCTCCPAELVRATVHTTQHNGILIDFSASEKYRLTHSFERAWTSEPILRQSRFGIVADMIVSKDSSKVVYWLYELLGLLPDMGDILNPRSITDILPDPKSAELGAGKRWPDSALGPRDREIANHAHYFLTLLWTLVEKGYQVQDPVVASHLFRAVEYLTNDFLRGDSRYPSLLRLQMTSRLGSVGVWVGNQMMELRTYAQAGATGSGRWASGRMHYDYWYSIYELAQSGFSDRFPALVTGQ